MTQKTAPSRGRRLKSSPRKGLIIGFSLLLLALVALAVWLVNRPPAEPPRYIENPDIARLAQAEIPDWITRQLLPEDCDSRRGDLLEDITGIAIHYVGNPGSTAQQNRNYFGNPGTEVNAHFLVGLDGEILQCLPLEEKSSATSERNRDTISIEVCHPDEFGEFTPESYDALVKLTAWLLDVCQLDETAVIRHYDVTGKLCPLYYVEHEDAWLQLKADIAAAMP